MTFLSLLHTARSLKLSRRRASLPTVIHPNAYAPELYEDPKDQRKHDRILLGKAKTNLPKDLILSAMNFETVLGKPSDEILLQLWKYPGLMRDELLSWKDIGRGEDLRVKGIGKFNVQEAYGEEGERQCKAEEQLRHRLAPIRPAIIEKTKNLVEPSFGEFRQAALFALEEHINDQFDDGFYAVNCRETRDLHARLSADTSWLIPVQKLQAQAYYRDYAEYAETILSGSCDCPARKHLIKFSHAWKEPRYQASIDELARVADQHRNGESYYFPDLWEEMNPRELVNSLQGQRQNTKILETIHYTHLDGLLDAGDLRVIRSNKQLRDLGLALNNCALDYHETVERNKAIIVALDHQNRPGEPHALGMIRYDEYCISRKWAQILLANNEEASDCAKRFFYDFEPALNEWHRQQYHE